MTTPLPSAQQAPVAVIPLSTDPTAPELPINLTTLFYRYSCPTFLLTGGVGMSVYGGISKEYTLMGIGIVVSILSMLIYCNQYNQCLRSDRVERLSFQRTES